jgi:hypothetical protein
VLHDAREVVEGSLGPETHRGVVVLDGIPRGELGAVRVRVDPGDPVRHDRGAVEQVLEGDCNVLDEAGTPDQAVDLVAHEVFARIVDDDDLGVGGEGAFESAGHCDARVAGSEDGDVHAYALVVAVLN